MTDKLTLAQKIAKASTAVGGRLKADAKNTEQKYEYISADKILSVCGQALAEVGVTVFPSIVVDTVEVFDRGQGKFRYDAAVTFHMHVSDGETTLQLPWVGRGSDYTVPDKALYKAITSGHKYFIAKLFSIGEGNEDGEHEVESEQPAKPQPQRPQPKPAEPQPAPQSKQPAAHRGARPVAAPDPVQQADDDWPPFHPAGDSPFDIAGYRFKGRADAITWGASQGVFENKFEAGNSFEKHATGKNWDESCSLWIETIRSKLEAKLSGSSESVSSLEDVPDIAF